MSGEPLSSLLFSPPLSIRRLESGTQPRVYSPPHCQTTEGGRERKGEGKGKRGETGDGTRGRDGREMDVGWDFRNKEKGVRDRLLSLLKNKSSLSGQFRTLYLFILKQQTAAIFS